MTIETGAFFRITATTQGQAQVDKLAESLKKVGAAGETSAAQTAMAFRMLPAQFTDIATQLAGGQSPFMILLQQGGQIKDSFGGVGNAFRALATLITPARVAFGGLAATIGLIAKAGYDASHENDALARQLAMTGNVADMSRGKIDALASSIAKATGNSVGNNRELITGAIGAGFTSGNIAEVTQAMAEFQKVTGSTAEETIKAFDGMAQSASSWAAKANRAYAFLTPEQYRYIRQLELQGKNDEAAAEASRLLGEELERRKPQLSGAAQLWEELGNKISGAWRALKNFVSEDTSVDAQFERMKRNVTELQALVDKGGRKGLFGETIDLEGTKQELADAQTELDKLTAKREEASRKAKDAADQQKKVDEEVRFGQALRAADVTKFVTQENDAINDRIEKTKQEQQQVEAMHSMRLMSDGQYFAELHRLQDQATKDQLASIDIQMRAERMRQGDMDKAGVAASNAKLLELELRKGEVIRQNETTQKQIDLSSRITDKFKSDALRNYTQDLKFQNDMLALQAQAVEMSNFEFAQLVETKRQEHEIDTKTRGMAPGEASSYREVAKAAGELRLEIEKVNYEQSRTWQYGAKEALKNYADEATNTARQVEGAMTNAFHGMEDALVEFAMTGKFNFRDLATSIIKDLIRIQIQSSITGPLAAAMKGMAGSWFGGTGAVASPVASGSVTATALPSLDGGGYTGSGSRSGGMDGKGGFLAMLHPQESVVDHYRGQGSGGVSVNVTVNAQTGQVEKDGTGNPGQLGAAIGAAIRQELINQKRPGGLLAA